jgi:pimeloyl-ACP methyl ester carboxylesterase
MQVDLVNTRTTDGLRLDGALQVPASKAANRLCFDAAILLSGVGSNFYGSSLMEYLAGRLAALGVAALRVNTRGHDGVSTASTPGGGKLQGAAYEIVDECRYDVAAWTDFLVERGFPRVALIGHSLGAIKALYAQAHEPQGAVRQIVAISPPRLSNKDFRVGPQSAAFFQSMAAAEQLISDGKPQMLFQASFPFPLILSAATYVDKYGPPSRYNVLRFATRVDCPIVFVYGAEELKHGGVAFAGLPDALAELDWQNGPPPVVVIPNANHLYVGCHNQLADKLVSHLSS